MKFEVGEIAIYVGPSTSRYFRPGDEVTVHEVGPFSDRDIVTRYRYAPDDDGSYLGDYIVTTDGKRFTGVIEDWLKKKRPPEQVGDLEAIKRVTGWSPIKTNENETA